MSSFEDETAEQEVVPEVMMGIDPETHIPVVLLTIGEYFVKMSPDGADEMAQGLAMTAAMTRQFAAEVEGLDELAVAEKVAEMHLRLAAPGN